MQTKLEEDLIFKKLKYGLCSSCRDNIAEEKHTCPYSEEIHSDYTLCNCCDRCSQNCTDDI